MLSVFFLFLLLLFLPISTTIAQNASTTACCAMTESSLKSIAAEKPDCSFSNILSEKCQSCPPGTCRLDKRCICPDAFLSSSTRRSQCSNAFGINWPGSIRLEDRDWRSCNSTAKPPPSNATSCCDMSEPELQALRGFNSNCPSSSYDFQLAKKCDRCPPGLCRLDDECICPDGFLDRTTLHGDCAASFTASWPLSVGKEDRASRSCRGVLPPKSTGLSCCSLTETQLNNMIGTSGRCPDSSVVRLSDECGACPSGMCRFETSCYCPTRFLTSSVKDRCERTFGVAWPESIGKPDPDIASCGNETKVRPTTDEQSSNSTTDPEDASNADNQVPDSSDPSPSSADKDTPPAVNPEQRLSTLEIVGIAAGVVSAVVTVLVAGIGLTRRRRNRHQEQPTFDEMLS